MKTFLKKSLTSWRKLFESFFARLDERTDTLWRTVEFAKASFSVRFGVQTGPSRRMKRPFKRSPYIHESLLPNPSPYSPFIQAFIQKTLPHLSRNSDCLILSVFLLHIPWKPSATSATKTLIPSEGEQGEGFVSQSICICVYARANNIKVYRDSPIKQQTEKCKPNRTTNQRLSEKVAETLKKVA